jgi:Flp pilus assembly protein TadD
VESDACGGWERSGAGAVREAIVLYEEVLRVTPNMFEAHNNPGINLARTGRIDRAIGHFRQALLLRPGDRGALGNLNLALGMKRGK